MQDGREVPRATVASERLLRVALDATPLLGPRSGVGEFCYQALRSLSLRADTSVGAYAVSWRRRHGIRSQVPAGVDVLDRPMPARPLHRSWSLWPFPPVEWFIGGADVVHGTNFVVPPTARAAMVVTIHDLTPVHFPELVEPATRALPALVRKALRRGAWAHTPSQFVADEVVEAFGASPERVRAVHHGVTPFSARAGAVGGAARAGSSPGPQLPGWVKGYILALGTVEPRKDLPTLVKAFGLIAAARPGLALVVAGREAWGKAQLDSAVSACPARDRVLRLGVVDEPARDELLRGATVLAYPSLYEGFGFPPLEAMSAGAPVVTTRCGALEEVLGDAARFVDVGDAEAMAEALTELVDDRSARLELVRRGHERAALYTWEACAAGLVSLYHDAVSSAR